MTNPIDRVLNILSGSYMNRWKLTAEEEVAWREGLRSFTPDVLRAACNHVRADFEKWPPTLMEFRKYCIEERDKNKPKSRTQIEVEEWNDWAEKNPYGKFDKIRAGESAEDFRRRLVWESACAFYKMSSVELSAHIAKNRQANRDMPGG